VTDANIWGSVFESVYARTVDCSRFDVGDHTQQGSGQWSSLPVQAQKKKPASEDHWFRLPWLMSSQICG